MPLTVLVQKHPPKCNKTLPTFTDIWNTVRNYQTLTTPMPLQIVISQKNTILWGHAIMQSATYVMSLQKNLLLKTNEADSCDTLVHI